MINTIILGHALDILPKLPAESVNCVTTSPPYWGLRDYGVEPIIWDGDKEFYSESLKKYIPRNCKHEWGSPIAGAGKNDDRTAGKIQRANKGSVGRDNRPNSNFCLKCGAWRGSLGLEPTFDLYVKHLCDIFDEVKRVLRKDGVCFVNIGDSYGGSGNASGHTEDTRNLGYKTLEMGATRGNQKTTKRYAKCLLDIPYRFSIEMTNRGWIKRNTIIWWKLNCMPSSAPDRFTIDFEYLFFFTKNNKTLFWTNEKTLEYVSKKPLGIKGIEGKDWEWRKVGAVNENSPNQRVRDIGKGALQKATEKEIENYGKPKLRKMSLWTGHDYWFEQQFDEHTTKDDLDRRKNKYWSENIADGGSGKQNKGRDRREFYGKQGRNKRCVWIIPTQPFPEAHFAVYPEGLIEIPIKAGCPEFVCKKCGKARVKIFEPSEEYAKYLGSSWSPDQDKDKGYRKKVGMAVLRGKSKTLTADYRFVGYTDCGCNAGFESGIVLDPFMGAGTSALVALKQRKRFIGIEIKQEYIDMSYKRIARVQQRIF